MPDTPKPGLRATLELIWLTEDGLCQHVDLPALVCDVIRTSRALDAHIYSHEGRLHSHAGVSCPEYAAFAYALRALAAKYDLET